MAERKRFDEGDQHRAWNVGWQPSSAIGIVAKERDERATGKLRELIGRAGEMIATKRNEHEIERFGV